MFYVAIVQNGTTNALFAYEKLDDALAVFHSELAYRGEGRTSTFCLLFDEYGQILANETWVKKPEENLENDYAINQQI